MTDRERLVKILCEAECQGEENQFTCPERRNGQCKSIKKLEMCQVNSLADHILSDGWIRPPCKVGDTVYIPWHWDGQQGVSSAKVEEINIYDNKNHFMFLIDLQSDDEEYSQKYDGWKIDKSIGETVFLTREEAEKALAERSVAE